MSQKQGNHSIRFQTPQKVKRDLQICNAYGIFDSSSQKVKITENNPFTTFLSSPLIQKNIFLSEYPKQLIQPKELSQESEDDEIIKKWENIIKKKTKKINKQNNEKQKLCFIKEKKQTNRKMGKLLVLNLNQKNSKKLIFHPQERTLMPIPFCQYCKRVFENFAAVGGHKRVCKNHKINKKKSEQKIELEQ